MKDSINHLMPSFILSDMTITLMPIKIQTSLTIEAKNLIKDSQAYRAEVFTNLLPAQRANILQLNRLLLEATYPQACPKNEPGRVLPK